MHKPIRMLDIIAILRAARQPLTAARIAERLETSRRTVYRDIAALQSMGVPIDGAAGLGYILRPGFHLPPLNFSAEEAEALVVGLALLQRTGDRGLTEAAQTVAAKIAAAQPVPVSDKPIRSLFASDWHDIPAAKTDLAILRRAIREERVLHIAYSNAQGQHSHRSILPLALIYYIDSVVLAAWCDLRRDFRHFRADRISSCGIGQQDFKGRGAGLRRDWDALSRPIAHPAPDGAVPHRLRQSPFPATPDQAARPPSQLRYPPPRK